MYFILTNAGSSYLSTNPVVPALSSFNLGSSYNYTPSSSVLGILGTVVYSGSPSKPYIESNNLLRYTILLDSSVGDFSFGEIGLYLPNGVLFAIGVNSSLYIKTKTSNNVIGNTMAIDCYVPTDTSALSSAYSTVLDSASPSIVPTTVSIDTLPQASTVTTSLYIVPDPAGNNVTQLAVSLNGLWTLLGYTNIVGFGTTTSSLVSSVLGVQSWDAGSAPAQPSALGRYVLQFLDGPKKGLTSKVISVATGTATLSRSFLDNVMTAGSRFVIYSPTTLPVGATTLLSSLDPNLHASDLNALITHPVSGLLPLNGTSPMTGSLDAGGYRVVNGADATNPTDLVNLRTLQAQTSSSTTAVGSLVTRVLALESSAVRKNGSEALTGDLNVNGHNLTNVNTGQNPKDAVNLLQLQTAIANAPINPTLLTTVTPATNGKFVIQATSDTTLTLKYKGSDGVVRKIDLTIAP